MAGVLINVGEKKMLIGRDYDNVNCLKYFSYNGELLI